MGILHIHCSHQALFEPRQPKTTKYNLKRTKKPSVNTIDRVYESLRYRLFATFNIKMTSDFKFKFVNCASDIKWENLEPFKLATLYITEIEELSIFHTDRILEIPVQFRTILY